MNVPTQDKGAFCNNLYQKVYDVCNDQSRRSDPPTTCLKRHTSEMISNDINLSALPINLSIKVTKLMVLKSVAIFILY